MKKISCLALGLLFNLCAIAQGNSSTIEDLQNEIRNLERINDQLRAEINRLKSEKTSSGSTSNTGEEYRIQIGIQNNAIGSLSTPKAVSGTMVNGRMVYDIGSFQNPNEAFNLSQEMRKLNLAGSFVTRYVNGVRDYSYRFDPNQPQSSYRPQTSAPKSGINYDSESGSIGRGDSRKSKTMQIEE